MVNDDKKMKCAACKHEGEDFIVIHQIGVNNHIRTGLVNEPEVYFDICICPVCGSLLTDVKKILIKKGYYMWT